MTGAGVRRWLALFLPGIHTGATLAAILRGRVVRVVDGDTLAVADARHSGLWAAPNPIAPWERRHHLMSQASSPLAKTAVRIRKARTFIRHPVGGVRHWIHS